MDEVDRAQIQIERDLENAIQAALLKPAQPRKCCFDCGEPLAEHRQIWGLCLDCKVIREARDRRLGVGI